MSTFGISQNFRATSIVGRFGRTVAPEPEKVVEVVDDEDDDYSEEDEDDEDDSKKSKEVKSSAKVSAVASSASKKLDERVSCSTQFASFNNRYAEKTADHH
jgi:hypothetical protein